MPTNKQRREQARRHLERQLARRVENDSKRKQRNLIITISASVVVVVVIVVAVFMIVGDNKKSKSAAATPTDSSSASPTDSASDTTSAAPQPATAGPCGYTQTATAATKDVGFPPDPAPTPTTNRVLSINSTLGPIAITLDATVAPCTVQSIAYLAGKGYYDTTTCFRLVTASIFVLQCGDPANTGTGGPGYNTKDENLDKADYSVVGTVAMANAGAGTDGSQFFIIYKDSSTLPKSYTVIGKVTTGLDLIQKVAAGGEDDANGTGDGKPKVPITFTKVTVAPAVVGSGTMVTPAATAPAASSAPASAAPSSSAQSSPSASKTS